MSAKFKIKVATQVSDLNVRSSPGVGGQTVVGTVPKDSLHEAFEHRSVGGQSWYRIVYNGNDAWVGVYLQVIESYGGTDTNLANTNAGSSVTEADTDSELNILEDAKSSTITGGDIDPAIVAMLKTEAAKTNNRARITGSVKLFGIPHQFTPETDLRTDLTDSKFNNLGRKYMETIIAEAPIVTFIPGKPSYLPDISSKQRSLLTAAITSTVENDEEASKDILTRLLGDEEEIRYFSFKWDYYSYMRYVTLLTSATAVLLDLPKDLGLSDGEKIVPYYKYNWSNYKFASEYTYTTPKQVSGGIFKDIQEEVVDVMESLVSDITGNAPNYVQFYIEPNVSFGDSFSNNTQASMLEGVFSNAGGIVKEMAFLSDIGSAKMIDTARESTHATLDRLRSGLNQKDGFVKRLLSSANVTLRGANMVFPEIWNDSSYSKSYNISINLVSPYGTIEAIYLNVFVPMMHIIALAIPRQDSANSFLSPFLVKAFAKGMFNCEMGIVDSLSIEKGGNGDAWTVDGFPTEVKISLSIKDLYASLNISKEQDISLFFQNQSLIEFLANTCGVDLIRPEIQLKIDLVKTLVFGYFQDIPRRVYDKVSTSIRNNAFQWLRDFTTFSRN